MGLRIVKLPDVGEGVAEAEIVEWHVAEGDHVVEDQVLAAVMTDKATVEIPSPVSGTVVECGAEIGTILAVCSRLVTIEVGGGTAAAAQDQTIHSSEESRRLAAETLRHPTDAALPSASASGAEAGTTARIVVPAKPSPAPASAPPTARPGNPGDERWSLASICVRWRAAGRQGASRTRISTPSWLARRDRQRRSSPGDREPRR